MPQIEVAFFHDDDGTVPVLDWLDGLHGRTAAVLSHGLAKERAVPPKQIDLAVQRKRKYESNPAKHTYRGE